ncbi:MULTISPECIES: TrbI/VirB10 family protein [Roseicella]|uniref:Type IV secretion system protein VirB10 n=1 Tax=Roseicella aquatilis TaxID=2527868 RepID=A0A4R4D7Y5_9PROT|nr:MULTISPECIES: TrbI/VirB10 family protein [Roseicella]NOG73507.1 type IV secretion system protein VirB10 [Roseicella sp. DB1501]TCZ55787.1 type IV secretion system protein VirB10 [Roseicella aquatilis]
MSGAGKIGIVLLALVLLVVLYWLGSGPGTSRRDELGVGASIGAAGVIRRIEPLPPPVLPEPTPAALPAPPPRFAELTPRPARPRTPIRPAPIMGYEEQSTGRREGDSQTAQREAGEGEDALAGRLRATRTEAVKARRLRDPDLTITMGTIIPCTPQQPLNTQLEGFLTCVVPTEVRGTSGRVVLLDRGTRIAGQLRSGMRQGQNRAFVLWTRAETPDGVTIQLASPGTDALGQNGLDVDVETNFWSRFGGAIMLSFIDAGLQAAALGASSLVNSGGSGSNNIRFFQLQSGGRSAAASALDATVNIPPYGTRPQGEPAAIFTARDLDFTEVYRINSTRSTGR